MTFLPIIERELRVRARSRMTWWIRVGVGVAAALICIPQFVYSQSYLTPEAIGRNVFNGLVVGAALLCLGSCILTTEPVGGERRGGTLGLLLLTRVRIFDLLVGKLGSVGLASFGALLAFAPMLTIPVLAGGVTGGEAARKGFGLVVILFFALTAGLHAASSQPDRFKAARRALLLLFALCVLPYLASLMLTEPRLSHAIKLPSPIQVLVEAGDGNFKAAPIYYWASTGLLTMAGLLFLIRAGVRLKQDMREETSGETDARPAPTDEMPMRPGRQSWRSAEGKWSPIEWLVQRQRGLGAILWVAGTVDFLNFGIFGFALRFMGTTLAGSYVSVGLTAAAIQGTLIAWAASRFFLEARRSAELEVLLTTPIGTSAMVAAQWQVLKRKLRGPVVLMVLPFLFQSLLMFNRYRYAPFARWMPYYYLIGAVVLVTKVAALCWLGIWFGLRAANQSRAIIYAVGLTTLLPYVFQTVFLAILRAFVSPATSGFWAPAWMCPTVINLLFYLWLIRFTRERLNQEFVLARPRERSWAMA